MWLEYLRIARKVLVAHKFRSMLTVLSITVGAFSIVLTSSLAESGLTTLFRGIEEVGGGRIILVTPKQPERGEYKQASYSRGLTREDRDLLFSSLPHVVERSRWSDVENKDVIGDNGRRLRTDLVAGDGGVFEAFGMKVARGRLFTEEENQRHAKVCVLADKLAQKLFDGDAVGHSLSINNVRCRVIGQLVPKEPFGMGFGFDWLDVVYLPLEAAGEGDSKLTAGAVLELKTDRMEENEVVKRIVNVLLSERHNGVDDFQIFDFSGVMQRFTSMFRTMKVIVALLAGIALLVGGVGVMNMMLVSVSERVREIGVRKAIGANPQDIGRQFLLEAIVLAGTGGLIGVVAGIGVSEAAALLIRHFKPMWVSLISYGAVTWAMGVSIGVGVLFGYLPATRAARLEAIHAMKR